MRRIGIVPALLLAGCLLLTGCSAPEEVRQEAENRLEQYQPAFESGVKDAYGDKAGLKKVACPVLMSVGSPVPEVSYRASKDLTATLVVDGQSYDATYKTESGEITDTVHTGQIGREITDALPIDQSKVLKTKITDNAFSEPQFRAGADSLAKVMTPDNEVCLLVNVITSEDLSGYRTTDFNSIPALATLSGGSKYCRVTIVSLEDTAALSELTGKIQELDFSYSNSHPNVYYAGEYVDAFDHFHIRNTIELSQPQAYQPFRVTYNE